MLMIPFTSDIGYGVASSLVVSVGVWCGSLRRDRGGRCGREPWCRACVCRADSGHLRTMLTDTASKRVSPFRTLVFVLVCASALVIILESFGAFR
jgi:hypothetical protein